MRLFSRLVESWDIWRGKWKLHRSDENTIHVYPLGDKILHGIDECVCGPTTHPIERADGSFGWVIQHHSLDNREAKEK